MREKERRKERKKREMWSCFLNLQNPLLKSLRKSVFTLAEDDL